jgi:endonuclease YncB( thermonuclease family)
MRFKKLIFLGILASLSISSASVDYRSVRFVYDGDTILLAGGKKVRFLGINAPEIGHGGKKCEFMARAATKFNREVLKKSRVRLEYDQERRDRHGRLLAYVFLENGDMINTILVRKGLAHVMLKRPNLKYKAILIACQQKALKEKLGIWSRLSGDDEKFYLASRRSYRFHRPDCPFGKRISPRNRLKFHSRHDAFWSGYSPCDQCQP